MSSSSNSAGSSSSTPEILPFLQQLSQFSQGLAQQTYDWAGNEFTKDSQLTDANVQAYLATSASALAQAQNDTSRYDNLFQPQENNLIADANTYASQGRIQADMGSAEAGVAQSMDAGRQNAERDLQAYGIDPSSGRYDELEQAAQAQKGAAQAGAGNQARLADEATGRSLRSEAIQVGERYPGQIINSLNTAMQGFSGAENARLSNTNTGANAFGAAAPFIKFPPVSNASQSAQQSVSGSNSPGNGNQNKPPQSQGGAKGAGSGSGSGSGGSNRPQQVGSPTPGHGDWSQYQPGVPTAPGTDSGGPFHVSDPSAFIPGNYADNGPNAMPGGGSPFVPDPFNSGNDQMGNWGGADPSSATSGFADANQPSPSDPTGGFGWGDPNLGGGQASDYYNNANSGGDYSSQGGGSYSGGNYTAPDNSGFDSSGTEGDSGGYYAKGGPIGGAAPGQFAGHVPAGASPSGGARTDDVQVPIHGGAGQPGRAHLNVDEFVIPKDVAMWKGQEFFQKLIQQSRAARVGAPAKPKAGPPSQQMGQ